MPKITSDALFERHGIRLPRGKYRVYVRGGNYEIYSVKDDTEGCILVGGAVFPDEVRGSRAAFDGLYAKLLAAWFRKEPMEITVRHE